MARNKILGKAVIKEKLLNNSNTWCTNSKWIILEILFKIKKQEQIKTGSNLSIIYNPTIFKLQLHKWELEVRIINTIVKAPTRQETKTFSKLVVFKPIKDKTWRMFNSNRSMEESFFHRVQETICKTSWLKQILNKMFKEERVLEDQSEIKVIWLTIGMTLKNPFQEEEHLMGMQIKALKASWVGKIYSKTMVTTHHRQIKSKRILVKSTQEFQTSY